MALQGERGDKTDGLSHKRAEAIHDSSPKANAELEIGREPMFQLRSPSSLLPFQANKPACAELFRLPLPPSSRVLARASLSSVAPLKFYIF